MPAPRFSSVSTRLSRPFLGLAACVLLTIASAPVFAEDASFPADLVTHTMRLRQPSNAERLEALLAMLRERNIRFELQKVPNSERESDDREHGTNVIISHGIGERAIVVGAHFDAARLEDGTLSGGMVDNGASVIALIRAAEVIRKASPRHRIEIVLFDLEELGLLGSKHYADRATSSGVAAMINLDVINSGKAVIFGPAAQGGNDSVYGTVRRVCAQRALACTSSLNFPPSDDRSFQQVGVPNISFAIVPENDAHQLWLLLNGGKQSGLAKSFVPPTLATIHTKNDRPELLSNEAIELASDLVVSIVHELDRQLQ